MSSPPEPPLLAPPSLPTAWLPAAPAAAAGQGMARELRGHGGLNKRSVQASPGG